MLDVQTIDVTSSGGAGGGEGVLFLRAPSIKRIFGALRQKKLMQKYVFPIFDFTLGVIYLRKIA